MQLSRIVVKGFRSLGHVDVSVTEKATCVIGENNAGKSNLIQALRLCLDVELSSSFRLLLKDDIHCAIDQQKPFQVLIGVEFTGFEQSKNETAMLYGMSLRDGRARIFYRFRPKRAVRDSLAAGSRGAETLTLADYGWELFGGGNPAVDMATLEWDHENGEFGAEMVSLQHLQSFRIVYLDALRDVETDLANIRRSPLARLIEGSDISQEEREKLIEAVRLANQMIESSPTVEAISNRIDLALKELTGPAFALDVDLGLASPSFQSIIRTIKILLSGVAMKEFEPRRNGLGLNNVLYIAILIEYFRKRAAAGNSAGELIIIEEPEAHLHPQLQLTLLEALRILPFQTIVTTHSTHITAKAPLSSFVMLTNQGTASPHASTFSQNTAITPCDRADLERYLDATKSNLLFARKVMLVEGPAEVFLIPPLVKAVLGVDLDREGVSVVAIHGTHFSPFAKLFRETGLPKKCAIVADADQDPEEADPVPESTDPEEAEADDDAPAKPELHSLAGPFVQVFLGATTFEREITLKGNLLLLSRTAGEIGAPRIAARLKKASEQDEAPSSAVAKSVLSTAKRFGKARFAQLAARDIPEGAELPAYIRDAVQWLMAG